MTKNEVIKFIKENYTINAEEYGLDGEDGDCGKFDDNCIFNKFKELKDIDCDEYEDKVSHIIDENYSNRSFCFEMACVLGKFLDFPPEKTAKMVAHDENISCSGLSICPAMCVLRTDKERRDIINKLFNIFNKLDIE